MPIYNAALKYIDEKETRRYAGLQKSDFPDKHIQTACSEAHLLSVPKGVWEVYCYDTMQAIILAPKILKITGEKIRNYLKECTQVAVMAVTIGQALEEAVAIHFAEGNYSHATLLDAAGTTAVEMAADSVSQAITTQYEKSGYKVLPRFSPGYGDWSLTEQPAVLRLANGGHIGMTVTESCMLEPRKSVTAIMGIKPSIQNTNTESHSNCSTCSQIHCIARKEK